MKQFFGKTIKEFDYNLFIEKWYPSVISFIIVIIFLLLKPVLITDNLDSILNAVISFTSILLGFIGVIIGDIFKDESHRKLMHIYFKRCIQAGFILIAFTILLFFRNTIMKYFNFQLMQIEFCIIDVIKVGWIFLTPYFSLVSYRIISLVLQAAFIPREDDDNGNDDIKPDYSDLREKHQ
jgi:hypothetical protein